MGSHWNPKPMRPQSENPLFAMVEHKTVVKGLSPMQRQRLVDGTPLTVSGPTALRPADPTLVLKSALISKQVEEEGRHSQVTTDPADPVATSPAKPVSKALDVIKAFLAGEDKEDKEDKAVSKGQIDRMNSSLAKFAKSVGSK